MDHHRVTPQFEAKITDNQPALVDLTFRPTKSMSGKELHKQDDHGSSAGLVANGRTDGPAEVIKF